MHLTPREIEKVLHLLARRDLAQAEGQGPQAQPSRVDRGHLRRRDGRGARGQDGRGGHEGRRRGPDPGRRDGGRGRHDPVRPGRGRLHRRQPARHRPRRRSSRRPDPEPIHGEADARDRDRTETEDKFEGQGVGDWLREREAAPQAADEASAALGGLIVADGDIEINAGRPVTDAQGQEHRRPADPGRLALPLLRGQPRPGVRPRRGLRHAARHPRRAPPSASSRATRRR